MSARPSVSPTTARRLTLAAQGASVLLLGAGVVVVARGVPEPRVETPALITPTGGQPSSGRDPAALLPNTGTIDWEGITERLSLIDNAPRPAPDAGSTPDPVETEEPQVTGDERSIAKRVRYLGHIEVGRDLIALLSVDSVQRTCAAGAAVRGSDASGLPSLRVEEIEPSRVRVSDGRASTWVDRTDGGGVPLTTIAAPPPPPSVATSGTTINGRDARSQEERAARAWDQVDRQGNNDPLRRRLESIDRLYEQGRLDQERYESLRTRALEQMDRFESGAQGGDDQ